MLTLLCAAALAQSLPEALPLEAPQVKELEPKNQKRQTPASYSTSIVHGNSEDGQSAHSSISVNFGDKENKKQTVSSVLKYHKPQVSFKQNIQQKPVQSQRQNTPKRQNVQTQNQNEALQQNEPQSSQNQPQVNIYPTPKTILDYIKHELPTTPSSIQGDEQHQQFSDDQHQFTEEQHHQYPQQSLHQIPAPQNLDANLLAPLLVQNQGPYLQQQNSIPNFGRPHQIHHQYPQENFHRGNFHREKKPTQQLFNVGYSINIMNQEPNLRFRVPHPNFRQSKTHGDIITGGHKDTVGKPSEINYVEQNPGYNTVQGHMEVHHPIKVFPSSYIDVNSNTNSVQIPQKEEKENYVWKNLSPGVEISGYLSEEEQSNNFDHVAALGKSEGFDITNAVDTEPNAVNIKPTFKDFKTNLRESKLEPEQSLYEKFYKNNPIYYKQDLALPANNPPINLELYKSAKQQVNDLTVFPQNFEQKLVIPSLQDQNFLKFHPNNNFLPQPEVHVPSPPQKYLPQYQIHENNNEGLPKNFFRQGRIFSAPPRSFQTPFGHPYRMRYSRDGHVQYLRPPPLIYRMPKYVQ